MLSNRFITRIEGVGYQFVNPEAATYVAAMTVQPDARHKELIDVFVGELKTADIWDDLDIVYLPAAHDEQAGRLNLKNPGTFTCTNVGAGPAFAAEGGITGSGSTGWNTGWNPTLHGVNYQQDNASMWVWCNTTQAAANVIEAGSNAGTARANIYAYGSTGGVRGMMNDATLTTFGGVVTDALGLTGITRASSTHKTMFKNLTNKGSEPVVSTGLPNLAQYICMPNPSPGGTKQIGFAAWGASLAGKETALYNAVYNYMNGFVWITGEFFVVNGDSGTNSILKDELESQIGWPVIDIGVGGTTPDLQEIEFHKLPTLAKKYCYLIDFDLGINPTDPVLVVGYRQSQIAALADPKRYLVFEPSPGENYAGTPYRTGPNGFDAQVAAMDGAWGNRFVRRLAELQALNDGSPEDLADVAGDIVPGSLRSDHIHEETPATVATVALGKARMQSLGDLP